MNQLYFKNAQNMILWRAFLYLQHIHVYCILILVLLDLMSSSLFAPGLGAYGSAWYVNGELAPDIYLVKGQEYTFIVEVSQGQGAGVHLHSKGQSGSRGIY